MQRSEKYKQAAICVLRNHDDYNDILVAAEIVRELMEAAKLAAYAEAQEGKED